MKKFLFLVIALLLLTQNAWALNCKTSQSNQSDECWTVVKVSNSETTPVISGTVLRYDFTSSTGADDSSFQVRVATASGDAYLIAGVAQNTIATGDEGMILVRGKGKVRLAGAITSGDRLFASSTAGALGGGIYAGNTVASRDPNVAFALKTETAAATTDAYITVI